MTELELSEQLGILLEPTCNRVEMDTELKRDLVLLNAALHVVSRQKESLGSVHKDLWLELIPWHSLN